MKTRINNINRIGLLILLFFIGFYKGFAQSSDMGFIITGEAGTEVNERWEFSLKEEIRLNQYGTKFDRLATKVDVGYIFWKPRLEIGGAFYFIHEMSENNTFDNRYRVNVNLSYKEKINQFEISYRARYQNTFFPKKEEIIPNPEMIFRNKIEFIYNFDKVPLSLFVSGDLFLTLNQPRKNGIESIRTKLGVEYEIAEKHSLIFYLRADNELMTATPDDTYYLGITYKFDY